MRARFFLRSRASGLSSHPWACASALLVVRRCFSFLKRIFTSPPVEAEAASVIFS